MCLIGNDLLHINTNKNTFLRKGADKIILNKFEINLFYNEKFENVLTLVWTIKESIYKITCKQGNLKAFSPLSIKILNYSKCNNNIYGSANFENQIYFFKTIINSNYVYSFAITNEKSFNNIEHLFFKHNSKNESLKNENFANYLKFKNWELVHTINGVPKIKNYCNIDVSISHDKNTLVFSNIISI